MIFETGFGTAKAMPFQIEFPTPFECSLLGLRKIVNEDLSGCGLIS